MSKSITVLNLRSTIEASCRKIENMFGPAALDYFPRHHQLELLKHHIKVELANRMIWVEIEPSARAQLEDIYLGRIPFPTKETEDIFYQEIFDFLYSASLSIVDNLRVTHDTLDLWSMSTSTNDIYRQVVTNEGDYRVYIFNRLQTEMCQGTGFAYDDDSGIKGYHIKQRYRLRPVQPVQGVDVFREDAINILAVGVCYDGGDDET